MTTLKTATPDDWVGFALTDFDAFLLDHASCERKAAAVGMSFVVRYPDRTALIEPMIQFAREELEHFHQVYRLIEERGLKLARDEEDPYVNLLMKEVRSGRDERLLDRLIVSALIEARGHERLTLVAEHLDDSKLKPLYARLARAEGHHKDLFIDLACQFFDKSQVEQRLDELALVEARAISALPYRSALH